MRRRHSIPTVPLALAVALSAADAHAQAPLSLLGTPTTAAYAPEAPGPLEGRSIAGLSGALKVAVVHPLAPLHLPLAAADEGAAGRHRWVPLYDTRPRVLGEPALDAPLRAPAAAGVWTLDLAESGYVAAQAAVTVITPVPITEKKAGRLNGYRIGSYPTEGSGRTDRYAPPAAFIEVTQENQDLHVSDNFQLRQFLTKDQVNVWPKYLALDLRLVDKLELVLQELNAMGVQARRMHVMSGFRTPQYNGPGGDGRATLSRHMYGDASDVWVDDDGDGYIDDLNGDGRRDLRDAEVMLRAVERVERKHPELVGGAGVYQANSAHGPFIHVDVRGTRSRW